MKLLANRAFMMIMVTAALAVILLVAWAVVNIGCGEILQTRAHNDVVSAFYVASAGAEKLYATLKANSSTMWGVPISGNLPSGGTIVGNFTAVASIINGSDDTFLIVSNGTVNGHRTTATVKYGFVSNFTGGIPLASIGPMVLDGNAAQTHIKAEGPAYSGENVTSVGNVTVTNGIVNNQTFLEPTFWTDANMTSKVEFNVLNNASYLVEDPPASGNFRFIINDTDGSGNISYTEALAQNLTDIFNLTNKYSSDSQIDEKDAFFYYFTTDLNDKYNLSIFPGQAHYYSGDRTFDRDSLDDDVEMIFVDGNVIIDQNDQDWRGHEVLHHTIAATGNITIYQPTNKPGDLLTLVAFRDIYSNGTTGNVGGANGDFVLYAHNNITLTGGGKANASIFAKGSLTVDTGGGAGNQHRQVNVSTIDWSDSSEIPIGLPKNYAQVSISFTIENDTTFKSVWQKS